ncbi:MAG: DUF3365 domain-containing protein [Thermodesulfobacteriota bacterium]
MGIRVRFLIMMGILSLLALVAMGWSSYEFSRRAALDEAQNKAEIIFNYILAQRTFYKKDQSPLISELVEKDRFYPNLMSGFYANRKTFDYFNNKMPGFVLKYASTNPLLESNKADNDELMIIEEFKSKPELTRKQGTINKNGNAFFYRAMPLKVDKKSCLRCHGDPIDAPKDQVEIYGSTNGYNWKMGDLASTLIIYIPIAEAISQARQAALMILAIGAGGLLFTMFIIGIFLERGVAVPLEQLNRRTEEISLGKNLDTPLPIKSKDEIGSLSRAIDRLRISVGRMLRRK